MKEIERNVLALINTDDILEYLGELVAIPSFDGEESVAQKKIASKLEDLGLEVDVWKIDFNNLQTHQNP